jgi:DNA modification methylase
MQVEKASISSLVLDPANARKHSAKNLEAIKGSLARFGQQKPIVVGKGNVVIAGNGTLEAARALGWDEIDIVRTGLEGTDATAFAIADNRTGELAEWDAGVLSETLKSLQEMDFDLGEIGFDPDDLGKMIAEEAPTEGLTDADAVPENVETRCKPGDLWILGEHRLLCGDSTNVQHVERLMGGEKADCLFTDPPYNIGFVPPRGTHGAIANDDMSPEAFGEFLRAAMACAHVVTKEDSYAFVWSGWSTLDQFAPVLRGFYTIKALPIWVKNNFGIGYYSRPKYEPYFLCLRGEPPRPEVAPADVWEHAKVHDTVHSCEKPVGLIEAILGAYVGRASVLDLFLGSGSTLIACEKTGRRCFGMEIDPAYCDVILARWEAFTGKQACLETAQKSGG